MPEDLYPRPIALANYTAFQAGHLYAVGDLVKPTTPNNHIYRVTTAGTSGSEPSWPTSSQGTVTSGGATFTEHGSTANSVQYLKYLKRPKAWDEITVFSDFEDGGQDALEHAADAPQYYEFEYDGLLDTEAAILDSFYDSKRLSGLFTLVEPRDHPWSGTPTEGSTVNGCKFAEPIQRDHDKVRDTQKRKVVIVKRPA